MVLTLSIIDSVYYDVAGHGCSIISIDNLTTKVKIDDDDGTKWSGTLLNRMFDGLKRALGQSYKIELKDNHFNIELKTH